MAVVSHFDWENRLIYMAVDSFLPIEIYREHRAARAASEEAKKFPSLLSMEGNFPKGGGKRTPRYLLLKLGAKIVPLDGIYSPITNINGEILTDDQTPILNVDPLTVNPLVNYAPPLSEVIEVTVSSGSGLSNTQAQTLSDIKNTVDNMTVGLNTTQANSLTNIENLITSISNAGSTGLTAEQSEMIKLTYLALLGKRVQDVSGGTVKFYDELDNLVKTLNSYKNGERTSIPKATEIIPE